MISEVPVEQKALLEFLDRLWMVKRDLEHIEHWGDKKPVFVLIAKSPDQRYKVEQIIIGYYVKKFGVDLKKIPQTECRPGSTVFHFMEHQVALALIDL